MIITCYRTVGPHDAIGRYSWLTSGCIMSSVDHVSHMWGHLCVLRGCGDCGGDGDVCGERPHEMNIRVMISSGYYLLVE